MKVDTSELRALAEDQARAGREVVPAVLPVVHRGAGNIKRQLRAEMSQSRSFKQITPLITYDIIGGSAFGTSWVGAEIGPEARDAGLLENIAYFGTSRGGGTVPDPQGALEAEVPKFIKHLTRVMKNLAVGS